MKRRYASAAALLTALAGTAHGDGTGEHAVLIIDPTNAESLYVANVYRSARSIPDSKLIYMNPGAVNYAQAASVNVPGFLGTLANRDLAETTNFVILPSGGEAASFYVNASGLISDSCSPVTRLSASSIYTLAQEADTVLGGMGVGSPNGYYIASDEARAFSSQTGWLNGSPSQAGNARKLFIGGMLGYTGNEEGNTLQEVLDNIARSAAADGTRPAGTFYFMQTTDVNRSSPRHGLYPTVVSEIQALGGQAQHLMAVIPTGNHDCLGIMTGAANPNIASSAITILNGAFGDHLTSYAATFDNQFQRKVSVWIAEGASTSVGAVEEPCNYSGKFPSARVHVHYFQGLTTGEAYLRSAQWLPFQMLLYGDPLTRAFAYIPTVDVPDAPVGQTSGTIALTPSASTTKPGAGIGRYELLVDGVLVDEITGGAFSFDTTGFADGFHDVSVLAYDDTMVENVGAWRGSIELNNYGQSTLLQVKGTSGDLSDTFGFSVTPSGGTIREVRLMQGGRVLATDTGSPSLFNIPGQILGAGPARVRAETIYDDGSRSRSDAVELDIDYSNAPTGGAAPVAYSYETSVLANESALLELPAVFRDDPTDATWTVLSTPSQASLPANQSGPHRVIQVNAGAFGSDSMTFEVETPSGTSSVATITINYIEQDVDPGDDALFLDRFPETTIDSEKWASFTGAEINDAASNEPSPDYALELQQSDQITSIDLPLEDLIDEIVYVQYWTQHQGVESGETLDVDYYSGPFFSFQDLETVTSNGVDQARFSFHELVVPIFGFSDEFALRFRGQGNEANDRWWIDDVAVTLYCRADLTQDQILNTSDFLAFLNLYNAGQSIADWNRDGLLNTADFIDYLNSFNAGCY